MKNLKLKYALSDEGARSMVIASVANVFYNLVLFSPVVLLYFLIKDILDGTLEGNATFYVSGICIWIIMMTATSIIQYNTCFFLHLQGERRAQNHVSRKTQETACVVFCKKRLRRPDLGFDGRRSKHRTGFITFHSAVYRLSDKHLHTVGKSVFHQLENGLGGGLDVAD